MTYKNFWSPDNFQK